MNARFLAERASSSITRWIGARWGDSLPYHYVIEYPKSGGTWLARMVADYLQLPFPQQSMFPFGFACVIQSHWEFDARLKRVFYVYRDGRDVMASFYFDRVRVARYADRPGSSYLNRTYERIFGKNYDPEDIVRHLPRFIEFEFANPGRGTPLNWRDHVESWHRTDREGEIAYLSYEGLLEDCAGNLGRAVAEITGEEIDPWRMETTVEKLSMKRQTGRDPGQADLTQHIRKGVAGDWLNHFSREAAERFDQLAGDTLVKLGYESDRGWIDRYEYPTP